MYVRVSTRMGNVAFLLRTLLIFQMFKPVYHYSGAKQARRGTSQNSLTNFTSCAYIHKTRTVPTILASPYCFYLLSFLFCLWHPYSPPKNPRASAAPRDVLPHAKVRLPLNPLFGYRISPETHSLFFPSPKCLAFRDLASAR